MSGCVPSGCVEQQRDVADESTRSENSDTALIQELSEEEYHFDFAGTMAMLQADQVNEWEGDDLLGDISSSPMALDPAPRLHAMPRVADVGAAGEWEEVLLSDSASATAAQPERQSRALSAAERLASVRTRAPACAEVVENAAGAQKSAKTVSARSVLAQHGVRLSDLISSTQLKPIPTKRSKSGYLGVYPARHGRWQAQVQHRSVGGYASAWEAGVAVVANLVVMAHAEEAAEAQQKSSAGTLVPAAGVVTPEATTPVVPTATQREPPAIVRSQPHADSDEPRRDASSTPVVVASGADSPAGLARPAARSKAKVQGPAAIEGIADGELTAGGSSPAILTTEGQGTASASAIHGDIHVSGDNGTWTAVSSLSVRDTQASRSPPGTVGCSNIPGTEAAPAWAFRDFKMSGRCTKSPTCVRGFRHAGLCRREIGLSQGASALALAASFGGSCIPPAIQGSTLPATGCLCPSHVASTFEDGAGDEQAVPAPAAAPLDPVRAGSAMIATPLPGQMPGHRAASNGDTFMHAAPSRTRSVANGRPIGKCKPACENHVTLAEDAPDDGAGAARTFSVAAVRLSVAIESARGLLAATAAAGVVDDASVSQAAGSSVATTCCSLRSLPPPARPLASRKRFVPAAAVDCLSTRALNAVHSRGRGAKTSTVPATGPARSEDSECGMSPAADCELSSRRGSRQAGTKNGFIEQPIRSADFDVPAAAVARTCTRERAELGASQTSDSCPFIPSPTVGVDGRATARLSSPSKPGDAIVAEVGVQRQVIAAGMKRSRAQSLDRLRLASCRNRETSSRPRVTIAPSMPMTNRSEAVSGVAPTPASVRAGPLTVLRQPATPCIGTLPTAAAIASSTPRRRRLHREAPLPKSIIGASATVPTLAEGEHTASTSGGYAAVVLGLLPGEHSSRDTLPAERVKTVNVEPKGGHAKPPGLEESEQAALDSEALPGWDALPAMPPGSEQLGLLAEDLVATERTNRALPLIRDGRVAARRRKRPKPSAGPRAALPGEAQARTLVSSFQWDFFGFERSDEGAKVRALDTEQAASVRDIFDDD